MALIQIVPKPFSRQLRTQWRQTGEHPDADICVYLKIFDPCGAATWYITEQDPEPPHDLFGLVCLQEQDTGYIRRLELRSYQGPLGIGLERDRGWTPISFQELRWRLAEGKMP